MEKLTIKELAPYLPYEVRIKNHNTEMTLMGSYIDELNDPLFDFGGYKPILHPLSDLTASKVSEIVRRYFNNSVETERDLQKIGMLVYNPLLCSYSIVEVLLSEHFDVFGLIEKGLAFNINNLIKI